MHRFFHFLHHAFLSIRKILLLFLTYKFVNWVLKQLIDLLNITQLASVTVKTRTFSQLPNLAHVPFCHVEIFHFLQHIFIKFFLPNAVLGCRESQQQQRKSVFPRGIYYFIEKTIHVHEKN